ncbi:MULTISPECIES: COG1361 S-layer family protein [unclassified Methanosarcina]|uniref:COG1361 S-layer family protein n=1 Tax=unclassified Methanosarcina TaxID=2644672 RepID=UPI0006159196|nr:MULTISPECIES: COG1361 S-layer family protein [unclassified Methanosarcina]AKB17822.1 NPCBM-associated, NEW3 domain of alpha-galactosidase [Methanosarcina sp. WWM596]AKB21169.1 NPCBM-associated, NEW3 domain of alpha-galactosidase [Methanosarcina sp. WH1]
MKKISILMLLILLLLIIPLTAGTALASRLIDSSSIQVSLTNQNPDAARPGEPVELTVSVQNVGNNDLEDIVIEITPEYPFSKVSGEALKKDISYLNARQDEDSAGVLKFKLMTDSNASEGTYEIDITTTAKSGGSSSSSPVTTTKTVKLEVRGKEYAQIVTINKANIDVAKEEPLEFIITNTGNSPLKNMVISWKDPKGVILPVYSDNTKYIKYLEPGDSVTVAYSVMADVNAVPGLYTLDINLTFEDYDSNIKNIKTTAGLFVGGETDFDVSFSESDVGEISLSVANVGNNMAYSVKVSVPKQEGYRVTGSSSTIVGNLEKGDYTITTFNVMGTQAANQDTEPSERRAAAAPGNESPTSRTDPSLKVRIEYTDARGERITVDKDVAVQMTASAGTTGTGGRSRATGFNSSLSSYLIYIVVIVVAGAGVVLYRRKKLEKIGKESRDEKQEDQKHIL